MLRTLLLAGLLCGSTVSAAVTIEKVAYHGWPNSYRMTNGEVDVIVVTDIGPRILRYGFVGGQNLLKEFNEQLGSSGESKWVPRGGHRLWVSPEVQAITYFPDNVATKAEVGPDSITITAPIEKATGIQKQMVVKLAASGTGVEVLHRLTNRGGKTQTFAPWALTMMAQGGQGITGYPRRYTHEERFLPTNPLVMWGFTDWTDPRWKLTRKYVLLKQDPSNTLAQKAGLFHDKPWGAYLLGGDLFLKTSTATSSETYPDYNCSFEMYTDNNILELETLGPIGEVGKGKTVEHVERWQLVRNVKLDGLTDDQIDAIIEPLTGKP